MKPIKIEVVWDDGYRTALYRNDDLSSWTRIVDGTPNSPCFAVSRLDPSEIINQLNIIRDAVMQR